MARFILIKKYPMANYVTISLYLFGLLTISYNYLFGLFYLL